MWSTLLICRRISPRLITLGNVAGDDQGVSLPVDRLQKPLPPAAAEEIQVDVGRPGQVHGSPSRWNEDSHSITFVLAGQEGAPTA